MVAEIEVVSVGLGTSPLGLAGQLNTFFGLNNPCSLIAVEYLRRRESTKPLAEIEITIDAGTGNYQAQVFYTDDTMTADQKTNAWFALNPAFRPFRILDISQELRRSLLQDAVVIIGSTDYSMDLGQGSRRLLLVAADNDIAAGASGTASVQGAAGDIGRDITVVNRTNFLWAAGSPGWAVTNPVDRGAGGWDGFPSCC